MIHSLMTHKLITSAARAIACLALLLPTATAQTVDPLEALLEILPKSNAAAPVEKDPAPEYVIPIAVPDNQADIHVKEEDGLISLTVRDAPLRQVVAVLAETQKLNIVFAEPTDVPVTASFERLPWRQALDALLSAAGHIWTDNDGVLFITSVDRAGQLSPRAGGRRVEVFELDFASAIDVDQAVKGLLSPAGKSWVTESSTDDNRRTRELLAVVDYPAHLQQIADYICQADQPPRQVLIEAHILQVELQDDSRSGVDFSQITSFSGKQIVWGLGDSTNTGDGSASFIHVTAEGLNGLVEALEETTDAKTLASPKILVVSGQESKIQIGEKLGFRVTTTTQTSSLESIKFLEVGVVLSVTPRITRDGRVLMHVSPKVSTGDVIDGLPSEETTEVVTDILLSDGEGMVIGGLIQERDSNIQSKIPWLGDLPYAGVLFQKRRLVKRRFEIIVTLLPHIQPYTPMVAQRDAHEMMRTTDPLTYGPLNRFPRPYEAMLPDTFDNPNRPVVALLSRRSCESCGRQPLTPLPSVDEESAAYAPESLPSIDAELAHPVDQPEWISDSVR